MLMRTRFGFVCLLLIALSAAAGCDSRPKHVPVSGKVLIDGEPLKFGVVVFIPEGGRQSVGNVDENGTFTLTCFKLGDGALVGTHHVQIAGSEATNNTTVKWYAPKKYSDWHTSGLVQEIKGPTDSVLIDLTWKGSTPDKPFVEHSDGGSAEDGMKAYRQGAKQSEK